MTPDAWGAAHRVYPPTTGWPGPRDPFVTPYTVEPMRAVHRRTHKRVVLATSAQTGKTDSVLDLIGERFDTSPVPTLYVGPTRQFLQDQLEPRLADLVNNTPLKHKAARGKKWKQLRKVIGGVPFRLAHAGSSAALKSDSFGLAITDEADELMANVNGAGDPISLIDLRGETYADFVHYITSTPSEGPSEVDEDPSSGLAFWAQIDPAEIASTIWRLWQSGTRYHWAWPCAHCSEYFIPRFALLRWHKPDEVDGKDDPAVARATAHMDCPHCGCELTEDDKQGMNARGVYVAPGQRVDPDGTVHGKAPDAQTLSYWVSGLASPFVTWGDRAARYVEATRSGDVAQIQAVVNGSFGELFAPGSGDVPEWRELERLKPDDAPFRLGEVPEWVRFLTCAVDVQKDRLIYGVRGWGARSTSCLVAVGELLGSTNEEGPWAALAAAVRDTYDGMPIRRVLVDSGFNPTGRETVPTNRVYTWCLQHSDIARPTKGRPTLAGRPVQSSKVDTRLDWRGRLETVGVELLLLDTDHWKRTVQERFRWPVDAPGAFLLPDDTPEWYMQQLVSEARIKRPGGKFEWVQRARDNHAFDVEAMQAAAGWLEGAQRIPETAARPVAPHRDTPRGNPVSEISAPRPARVTAEPPRGQWSARLNTR